MAAVLFNQKTEAGRHAIEEPHAADADGEELLRLIVDGLLSSKEIGDEVDIHYRTVQNHHTNMCRKLEVECANSLARFALQNRNALHRRLDETGAHRVEKTSVTLRVLPVQAIQAGHTARSDLTPEGEDYGSIVSAAAP